MAVVFHVCAGRDQREERRTFFGLGVIVVLPLTQHIGRRHDDCSVKLDGSRLTGG